MEEYGNAISDYDEALRRNPDYTAARYDREFTMDLIIKEK